MIKYFPHKVKKCKNVLKFFKIYNKLYLTSKMLAKSLMSWINGQLLFTLVETHSNMRL